MKFSVASSSILIVATAMSGVLAAPVEPEVQPTQQPAPAKSVYTTTLPNSVFSRTVAVPFTSTKTRVVVGTKAPSSGPASAEPSSDNTSGDDDNEDGEDDEEDDEEEDDNDEDDSYDEGYADGAYDVAYSQGFDAGYLLGLKDGGDGCDFDSGDDSEGDDSGDSEEDDSEGPEDDGSDNSEEGPDESSADNSCDESDDSCESTIQVTETSILELSTTTVIVGRAVESNAPTQSAVNQITENAGMYIKTPTIALGMFGLISVLLL